MWRKNRTKHRKQYRKTTTGQLTFGPQNDTGVIYEMIKIMIFEIFKTNIGT